MLAIIIVCSADGTQTSAERYYLSSSCHCPRVCRRNTSTALVRTCTIRLDTISITGLGQCSLEINTSPTALVFYLFIIKFVHAVRNADDDDDDDTNNYDVPTRRPIFVIPSQWNPTMLSAQVPNPSSPLWANA